jgi:hypothetical protein
MTTTIDIQTVMGTRHLPVRYHGVRATLTTLPCPEPGHVGERIADIEVPRAEAELLECGAFVQRALMSVDADTRERFISGICPPCWERLFGGFDESDG